jgi:hypothetical protein
MILEDDCDDGVKAIEPNVGIQFWWGLSLYIHARH